MTMTNASENTALLDDAALDSICGGSDSPPPPRVLPVHGNTWVSDPDQFGELNRATDANLERDRRAFQDHLFQTRRRPWERP
jgi:hypothetical protein